MKKILLIGVILLIAFLQTGWAQEKTVSPQLSSLLSGYYGVKDALISGNAAVVVTKANEFITAATTVNAKSLPKAAQQAYTPLADKLVAEATAIASVKDIAQQREHFKGFSNDFYQLAKAVPLSNVPIYQEYCPMQKAYWLSSSNAVKNPYYGKQMLSCGKVTDIIQ
ncbi:DUF3347 domain-containing protein [Chitinophaga sp. 30R24]|uniref:DUF3347 domain-containing protein n=1 Tax=Chitinophaga sp. 30R24 TaxID=3248838 RepID=UPI003B90E8BB